MSLSASLWRSQDAQSRKKKVNPRQAKSTYSVPAVFNTLSYGLVYQSGREIPPRWVKCYTHGTSQTERCAAKALWGNSTKGGGPLSSHQGRQKNVAGSSRGQPVRRIAIAWDAPLRTGRLRPLWTAPGWGPDPPPTPATPERSWSPGLSDSPEWGPPHPHGRFGSEPRGSQRSRPILPQSPEPPPPTNKAMGSPIWPCRAATEAVVVGGSGWRRQQ